MSVSYKSIQWNRQKKRYDLFMGIGMLLFLLLFFSLNLILFPNITFETLILRAFGLLAFFMLHIILLIGPLSRLNRKFLVILYNRRHLGVSMFLMAAIHGGFAILNFHALGDMNPVRSIFLSNLKYTSLVDFPFQVLGFFALLILGYMAVSSHDFWLKNLGPKVWKALHMMVYVAYSLIILHVVLGTLQNETSPWIFGLVMSGLVMIISVHLISAFKEINLDKSNKGEWIYAGTIDEIEENRARIITASGERIGIFKYDGKLSAVNNFCRHQGGPLGEGKIIDGCITCPWHGYQYLPANGQSPPPFTERTETYYLKLDGDKIYVNPVPNPPGTYVEPLIFTS